MRPLQQDLDLDLEILVMIGIEKTQSSTFSPLKALIARSADLEQMQQKEIFDSFHLFQSETLASQNDLDGTRT
jgi:hypothetical protein